jgi:tetratricopeptide (TPR) repeat protein
LQRIDPDRPFDVLELGRAEVGDRHVEPAAHLAISVLGQTNRARLGDAFEPRGDIDAIAHEIAVRLLHDVAKVDTDAKLDAALGRQPGVAFDHPTLHFDRAAHRVDHAAELDEAAVPGSLNDATVMHGDGRVDQVAAQGPKAGEDSILIHTRKPRVTDDVTAQLIDAASDAHLWSERWDRPSKDFFVIQTDIADQLGSRLGGGGVILKADTAAARRSRPENFTAYELFLAGRREHVLFTPEGTKNAIELLERAVAADPSLSRAWSELAFARQFLTTCCGADPAVVLPLALAAARRAVETDPSDALAHSALAVILGAQGDLAPSEAEFETALRLNPGDTEILALNSGAASGFGHPEQGAEMADHAIRLNPNYQVWQAWNFSWAYFAAGRFEDTLRILERLTKDNYLFYSWVLRAASYAALGPRQGGEGGHVGCGSTLPRPDRRGIHRDHGLDRRGTKTADRADASRGVSAMRETRGLGEKPAIGAPARMPAEMSLARRSWRVEAFLGLPVK